MKRTVATAAAVLIAALSVATPAQAAPPADCTNGSYSDALPPYHTHWVLGERSYTGGTIIANTTYRFWLRENAAYTPPLFVSARRATCNVLVQYVDAMQPTWQTGNLPCLVTGEYRDPASTTTYHVLLGERVNRLNTTTQATANFRFWITEQRSASGRSYLDSSIVMC
ncbi:hypothetical protein ACWEFJ_27745 [Actinosynnema sp. NPDC004786]